MEDDHRRIEEGADAGWATQCLQPLFPAEDTSGDCDVPQTLHSTRPDSRSKCDTQGHLAVIDRPARQPWH